jgi:broad specificity phosphatase PhoE
MKKIYFVRHGESEGNVSSVRQTVTASLTEKGRSQANFVSERCVKLPVEVVVSSTMNRAKETAEIISQRTSQTVDYSDLFVERRRASVVLGKPKDDPVALEIDREIKANFSQPGWRLADEENFDDLKDRALAALDYLVKRPEENILVVTHGFFLRIIMATVVFGNSLTGEQCDRFIYSLHMENTGITVLGYDENRKSNPWWLWTWNDHSHLG